MKKKILITFISAMIIASLTACEDKTSTEPDTASENSVETEISTTDESISDESVSDESAVEDSDNNTDNKVDESSSVNEISDLANDTDISATDEPVIQDIVSGLDDNIDWDAAWHNVEIGYSLDGKHKYEGQIYTIGYGGGTEDYYGYWTENGIKYYDTFNCFDETMPYVIYKELPEWFDFENMVIDEDPDIIYIFDYSDENAESRIMTYAEYDAEFAGTACDRITGYLWP